MKKTINLFVCVVLKLNAQQQWQSYQMKLLLEHARWIPSCCGNEDTSLLSWKLNIIIMRLLIKSEINFVTMETEDYFQKATKPPKRLQSHNIRMTVTIASNETLANRLGSTIMALDKSLKSTLIRI